MMNADTELHRQVHPSWVDANELSTLVFTSQTFTPTNKDEQKLSVANGSILGPKEAFDKHKEYNLNSVGTVTVTGSECDHVGLPYEQDDNPYPGHAFIDFRNCNKKQTERNAKLLKAFALSRGWTYLPSVAS